jgi:hypothetical protein
MQGPALRRPAGCLPGRLKRHRSVAALWSPQIAPGRPPRACRARTCPASGGRTSSPGSSARGTNRASRPASWGAGSSWAPGAARKTRSTALRADPGPRLSAMNATLAGSMASPVSSSVSRLAQAAMLSPGRGVPPGSTQSPTRSRWTSSTASARKTMAEQRTSMSAGVSIGILSSHQRTKRGGCSSTEGTLDQQFCWITG